MKNYADTYVFTQYPKYEKQLFEFIMKADRIDAKSQEFADILYDVKRRRVSDSLAKVLTSDNVVLGYSEGSRLPKAFKVFAAKDVKEDKSKVKAFIDLTDIIKVGSGYDCTNINILIAYSISAMTNYIYSMVPNKLVGNSSVLKDGGEAFVALFTYIIDRIYKISASVDIRRKVQYLAALYYQINILEKDFDKSLDTIKANAVVLSNIDRRNAALVDIVYKKEDFYTIDSFIKLLGQIGFRDIETSIIVSYWMNAFGTGTVFGLEYFPAFSTMLTDAYIGGYINNQITIEKITSPAMVKFTKTILNIGASVS